MVSEIKVLGYTTAVLLSSEDENSNIHQTSQTTLKKQLISRDKISC